MKRIISVILFSPLFTVVSAQLTFDSPQLQAALEDLETVPNLPHDVMAYGNSLTMLDGTNSEAPESPYLDFRRIRPVHFGFFCIQEARIDRRSAVAPRFRLGGLDSTNLLEGKAGL